MTNTTAMKWDVRVLAGAGAGLLLLAVIFLWRDLQVPGELLLAVGGMAAGALAFLDVPRERPLAGPVAVIVFAVGGGLWYAATKQGLLLVGLGAVLAVAVVTVLRSRRRLVATPDRVHDVLVWYGLTSATIAASWTFYFHFLTLGIAEDSVARRLVLTLGWLVLGVALVLAARPRGAPVMRDAGFAFVAIAVGKALVYDTTHLSGSLRVLGLAAAGLLMLGAAWLSTRGTARLAGAEASRNDAPDASRSA